MALGSVSPHTACPSDSALLKSDAAENSTFPFAMALGSVSFAMALGSAMPHTACQSDFAPAGEGERRSDLLIRQNFAKNIVISLLQKPLLRTISLLKKK